MTANGHEISISMEICRNLLRVSEFEEPAVTIKLKFPLNAKAEINFGTKSSLDFELTGYCCNKRDTKMDV